MPLINFGKERGVYRPCRCAVLTYPRSSPPKDSGGQTWRCSGCTRHSVWTWWASVSVRKDSLGGSVLLFFAVGIKKTVLEIKGFTKQVLQNMLRSRLPVSASSTIVWRRGEQKQTRRLQTVCSFDTATKDWQCSSWGWNWIFGWMIPPEALLIHCGLGQTLLWIHNSVHLWPVFEFPSRLQGLLSNLYKHNNIFQHF